MGGRMKLQNLYEGLQARTQKRRRGRRLNLHTADYQNILHAVAEALVPIIEGDEADLYADMYADEGEYDSMKDYFSRLDMQQFAENFGSNLNESLQEAWDKKWNTE